MILLDPELNNQLLTKGYAVFPFLDDVQVEEFKTLYQKYKVDSAQFHSTTFSTNYDQKKQLSDEAWQCAKSKAKLFLSSYRRLGASFLSKPPGQGGVMPVHQDWTIVDEKEFASYTIWIPLQDVNSTNGAITVLNGSHQFNKALRAPTLPVAISEIEPAIRTHMITLDMKAGEAFIFNHSLINASHTNAWIGPRKSGTPFLSLEREQAGRTVQRC